MAAGRIPCLDGIRALAVALVVLAHLHGPHGFPRMPGRLASELGRLGVEVFFTLSGFLITTLMLREESRASSICLRGFYRRRVLRIVPAYACYLLAVAGLCWVGLASVPGRDWLAALTYTINFVPNPAWDVGHAWSLSIEEHFYLVWPLVLMFAPRSWRIRAALACMAGCAIARLVVLIRWPAATRLTDTWTFTRLDAIVCGCLLALLAWTPACRARLEGWSRSLCLVGLTLVALAGSATMSVLSGKFSVAIGYSLDSVLIALLVWTAADRADSTVGRLLNLRVIAAVGVGSYSLYLWQQLFLGRADHGFSIPFPLNVAAAALLAWLSYRFIETPFLRLKDRRITGACASTAPAASHST